MQSLGPHRLSLDSITPETAFGFVPEEIWWETIARVSQLFPGNGDLSYCRDFSDVSDAAIERVFDRPLADFETLLNRARGLLFSDWVANREVHSILESFR